jgi:predicted N-acetyltransferase YhbS
MDQLAVTVRTMHPQDIPAGMRLKAMAGWNQTEADWQLFLATNPAGCFVAEVQGQVVGSVTTTDYGGEVAWIGMVLVDPDFRRQGIATRLTRRAMESISAAATIKLDATPTGRQVYEPLGFQVEYMLHRLTMGQMPSLKPSSTSISALSAGDWMAIKQLDRFAFGADRSRLLSVWAEASPQTAWQICDGSSLHGYYLGRPGANFYQLGPLIAATTTEAMALAMSALSYLAGQPVVIDVPTAQDEFLNQLYSLGFSQQRSFARMYHGQNQHAGRSELIFAAAGPEFG